MCNVKGVTYNDKLTNNNHTMEHFSLSLLGKTDIGTSSDHTKHISSILVVQSTLSNISYKQNNFITPTQQSNLNVHDILSQRILVCEVGCEVEPLWAS